MNNYRILVGLVACLAIMLTGANLATAGGSSDTSGEGYHCYLFFSLPDHKFAQAMVNDSDKKEVLKKADEYIEKYEVDEGGMLDLIAGNIKGSVCSPKIAKTCASNCAYEQAESIEKCILAGYNFNTCERKAQKTYRHCLDDCNVGECEIAKDCRKKGLRCCPNGQCVKQGHDCPIWP